MCVNILHPCVRFIFHFFLVCHSRCGAFRNHSLSLRRCSPLHPSTTTPTLTTSHDDGRRYHRLADPDKHVDLSQPPQSLIFHRSGHLGLTDTHERKLHSLSVNTPTCSPPPPPFIHQRLYHVTSQYRWRQVMQRTNRWSFLSSFFPL